MPFHLDEGTRVPFDELYDLFDTAGFIPADKARLIHSHRPDVVRTFERLSLDPHLLQAVVARGADGRPVGYLSAIASGRRTAMFQHLAGLPGYQTGGAVVVELVRQMIAAPEIGFMKFYFLADNPYPVRVYGSFGEQMRDERTCTMRTVAHVVTTCNVDLVPTDVTIRIREAQGSDLDFVEDYFDAHEISLVRAADDLRGSDLRLDALNRRYQRIGLYRQRHVLLAHVHDRRVGFALVELSSPGLNLSEGLSAFRVFVVSADPDAEDRVRASLTRAAQDIYRRAGRRLLLGLVDPADVPSYRRIGLDAPATSLCITMDRTQFASFANHVARRTRTRCLLGGAA